MSTPETCNFCQKDHTQVKKLIVGEPGVAICNSCIDLCNHIIEEECGDGIEGSYLEDIDPMELKEFLDLYVVSQDRAKIILSVAVANHYNRINIEDVEIDKSNVLLLGPSGSGKTLLAKTVAKFIDVPFATADATLLTEAGYSGDDVDSLLIKLVNAAGGDVELAETGIIFIDEVDKIARKIQNDSGADVSGEGVQQALLKLVEGSVYHLEDEVEIDTSNILFIASGAFVGLADIKKRAQTNIGFGANLHQDSLVDVDYNDLVKFGLIPEFVGRFPILAEIDELTEADMLKILSSVKNNLVGQYRQLFKYNDVNIAFRKEALQQIVKIATAKKTGARGLKSIMEKSLLPHMYNVVKYKQNDIRKVVITKSLVNKPKEIKKK